MSQFIVRPLIACCVLLILSILIGLVGFSLEAIGAGVDYGASVMP
jgi:hypothetical protein